MNVCLQVRREPDVRSDLLNIFKTISLAEKGKPSFWSDIEQSGNISRKALTIWVKKSSPNRIDLNETKLTQ